MVYTYKVTLEGIKGFHRVYKISGNYSLYTFHKQLRSDLEFTVDQPILFSFSATLQWKSISGLVMCSRDSGPAIRSASSDDRTSYGGAVTASTSLRGGLRAAKGLTLTI